MKHRTIFSLFLLLVMSAGALAEEWQHLPPAQVESGSSFELLFSRVAGEETPLQAFLFLELDGVSGPSIAASSTAATSLEFSVPALRTQGSQLDYWVELEYASGKIRVPEQGRYGISLAPSSSAGAFFSLLSADEVLPGGPTLLAFAPAGEDLDLTSVELRIDGVIQSDGLESDAWLVTWMGQLTDGPHRIELTARNKNGEELGTQGFALKAANRTAVQSSRRSWSLEAFEEFNMQRVESRTDQQWSRYHTGGLRARGKAGNWRWRGRVLLSGLDFESDVLQPQSRLEFELSHKHMKLGIGDRQPQFGNLVLSGTRVRGLDLQLKSRYARLALVSGKTRESLDPLNSQGFGGSFQRDLFGIDLGFGPEGKSTGNLSVMTVRDDISSITAESGTINPVDNLVIGTRFKQQFKGGKFWLRQEAAISLYNSNITNGIVDADLLEDSLGVSLDPKDFEDFIIINEYLSPLDLQDNPMSSAAIDAGLGLRVSRNEFKAEFQRVGPNYTSLGNAFLDSDRQRLRISDRLRVMQNQIYLDFGWGNSIDNLEGQYDAAAGTTTSSELKLGIGWYPRKSDFKANLGLSNVAEDNEALRDEDQLDASLNQVTLGLSKDVVFLERNHRLSLNIQQQAKSDNIGEVLNTAGTDVLRQDLTYSSFQWKLGLNSVIDEKMRSRVSIGTYSSSYDDANLGDRSWWTLRASLERDWVPSLLSSRFRFSFQGLSSEKLDALTAQTQNDDYSRMDLGGELTWRPMPGFRVESRLDFQFYSGERDGTDLGDTDIHAVIRLSQTL